MDNLTNLESLSKQVNLEKTLDFIQFRTSFINNFDFERLNELARTQLIKRSGSRSTAWKMMLGVIPNINDKELWIKTVKENRQKYNKLQDKYMKLNNLLYSPNPLASLNNPDMAKEIFSMKEDRDIKILIKKDVERTMQELPLFKEPVVQSKIEEILYLWAKEYPEFKYQQGMNEILAVIIMCVVSELNLQSLSEQQQQQQQQDSQLKHSNNKQESDVTNKLMGQDEHSSDDDDHDETSHDYIKKLFRELHDPLNIWADIYCMFENLMNLGVKELYYRDITKQQVQQEPKAESTDKKIQFKNDINQTIDPLRQQNTNNDNNNNMTKDLKAFTQYSSLSSQSSGGDSLNPQQISKEKQRRLRKQKLLELNQEDAKKTSLKKRSNKIFNEYLKEIDPELFRHIQEIDLQPELILLKYLRCLLSREFSAQSLLYVWDFILSGIDEEGRIYLQEKKQQTNSTLDYQEHHVQSTNNYFLKNMDYLCLAMIQLQRNYLLQADYIGCLKLTSKSLKLDCHGEVVRIADRIGKVIFDKMFKAHSLIQKGDEFPRILEQDVERFMQEYSLKSHESDEDEDVDSNCSNNTGGRMKPNRKCYKVKEEEEEEEYDSDISDRNDFDNDDDEEGKSELSDNVNDLSTDRIKDVDEVEATLANGGLPDRKSSAVGSIVIDEEGDTFVDCKNHNTDSNNKHDNDHSIDEKDESFHSMDDDLINEKPHKDDQIEKDDTSKQQKKQLFKLKDTKGKVVYDQHTKQRRFMSPFEQFIAEQEGLFKKDELRQHDEQNSVTLTTTASTQFDAKTVVITSLHSGSGSVIEEPITLPKKASQVMKPNNKLAKMANNLQIDAQVKYVEDSLMMERKQNIKQLRNIKGYLTGVKTGKNCHIKNKVMNKTQYVNSDDNSNVFMSLISSMFS